MPRAATLRTARQAMPASLLPKAARSSACRRSDSLASSATSGGRVGASATTFDLNAREDERTSHCRLDSAHLASVDCFCRLHRLPRKCARGSARRSWVDRQWVQQPLMLYQSSNWLLSVISPFGGTGGQFSPGKSETHAPKSSLTSISSGTTALNWSRTSIVYTER